MKLVKIDSTQVGSDCYNSSHHSSDDSPGDIPSEAPYAYNRWFNLIQRSQNIASPGVQHASLSPRQGQLLIMASEASVHTRVMNRMYAEELSELIAPSLSLLDFGSEGLFLRLDACSPKDGAPGNFPMKTVDDILLRITTSYRARNSIQDLLEANAENINLWFLPYNKTMNTSLEYRVFCAPPNGSITAISQYQWHKPSVFRDRSEEELGRIAKNIKDEVIRIHEEIRNEVKARMDAKSTNDGLDDMFLKQGFSFDVLFDELAERCVLIELNGFGARSWCGACLFHWLRDIDVLYGRKTTSKEVAEVEFRISV
jgi:hypothetical protein